MWYYHTPFHPAYFMNPPVVHGGQMYPGGVNWLNVFIGIVMWGLIIWFCVWMFRRAARAGSL
jgi:hypothetical protein